MVPGLITSQSAICDVKTTDPTELIWSCQELTFTINDSHRFDTTYPNCSNSEVVLVKGNNVFPENLGTSHRLTFGMSLWSAVAVHIILMEFYVSHRYIFQKDKADRLSSDSLYPWRVRAPQTGLLRTSTCTGVQQTRKLWNRRRYFIEEEVDTPQYGFVGMRSYSTLVSIRAELRLLTNFVVSQQWCGYVSIACLNDFSKALCAFC